MNPCPNSLIIEIDYYPDYYPIKKKDKEKFNPTIILTKYEFNSLPIKTSLPNSATRLI